MRITQMINFIATNKTRLQTQKKTIEDLTKENANLKASSQQQSSQQQPQEPAAESAFKAELDNLKSKFLQSKFENERMKKELESTNAALVEAKVCIKI